MPYPPDRYAQTPPTEAERRELEKLAVRRWRRGGHDPATMQPPFPAAAVKAVLQEEVDAKKHWWQR
jgi:hypothetical protein